MSALTPIFSLCKRSGSTTTSVDSSLKEPDMKPTTEAIQATSRDIENDGKHDPVRDFDFLFGCWRVAHRKLRSRLIG